MTVAPTRPEAAIAPPSPAEARLAIFDAPASSHLLSRRSLKIGDRTYRLFLATPLEPAPAGGVPILYALDGNAIFDLLDVPLLASVPGLIVAGIGHDTTLRFDPPMRSLDYTPAIDGGGLRPDPDRPDRRIGGADIMLDRLCGVLRAEVEKTLAVDAARRTLFGHSLAGLFAIYVLLTRPAAFSQFMAASPSIWWNNEAPLEVEARTPRDAPFDNRVFVTLGDSERRSSTSGPHWNGPAPHTLEMIRRLRCRSGIAVEATVLRGLGHAATLPASLPLALQFAATGAYSGLTDPGIVKAGCDTARHPCGNNS